MRFVNCLYRGCVAFITVLSDLHEKVSWPHTWIWLIASTFNVPLEQQNWAKFDELSPPPPPSMATNPDHDDYLSPRPTPKKPPPKPKPYAASKQEKEQQDAAVPEGRLPLCTSRLWCWKLRCCTQRRLLVSHLLACICSLWEAAVFASYTPPKILILRLVHESS